MAYVLPTLSESKAILNKQMTRSRSNLLTNLEYVRMKRAKFNDSGSSASGREIALNLVDLEF